MWPIFRQHWHWKLLILPNQRKFLYNFSVSACRRWRRTAAANLRLPLLVARNRSASSFRSCRLSQPSLDKLHYLLTRIACNSRRCFVFGIPIYIHGLCSIGKNFAALPSRTFARRRPQQELPHSAFLEGVARQIFIQYRTVFKAANGVAAAATPTVY